MQSVQERCSVRRISEGIVVMRHTDLCRGETTKQWAAFAAEPQAAKQAVLKRPALRALHRLDVARATEVLKIQDFFAYFGRLRTTHTLRSKCV